MCPCAAAMPRCSRTTVLKPTVSRKRREKPVPRSMYPDAICHWIGGADVSAASGASFEKRCPIDDRAIARVARGTAADVDRALSAAASAAEPWARVPPPQRGEVLFRAAALLRARVQEFCGIVRDETGKPAKNAAAEVASSVDL